MGFLHSKHSKTSFFGHTPLVLFFSIKIQKSASKGSLEEVVTMSRVWLLDPTTILVNPSYKKR
jgi:hypothetical protein